MARASSRPDTSATVGMFAARATSVICLTAASMPSTPSAAREIATPDEERVDPLDRGDFLQMRERGMVLDHGDAGDGRVLLGDVLLACGTSHMTRLATWWRSRASRRDGDTRRRSVSRLLRGIAVRHHYAGRPAIERGQDARRLGDPHDGSDVRRPSGEARDVDGRAIEVANAPGR